MIKKFISNAMLSIIMDKQAKEKLLAARENRKPVPEADSPETLADEAIVKSFDMRSTDENRQDLIRNAMALHKEKSSVLDDLSEKDRRRLELLALHTMMGKSGR